MNILFVTDANYLNLIYDLHLIAEGLAKKGHNIFILDNRWNYDTHYWKIHGLRINIDLVYNTPITLCRAGYFNLSKARILSIWVSQYFLLRKIIKQEKIEAIVVYGCFTNGWIATLLGKAYHIPVIFRMVDIFSILYHGIQAKITRIAQRYIIKHCDKVMALTHIYALVAAFNGAEDIEVLGFPVDTNIFYPKENYRQDSYTLLFMGLFYHFSGLEKLIDLVASRNRIKLLLVGDGSKRKIIEEYARRAGVEDRIVITGIQPFHAMPDYINQADICLNNIYPATGIYANVFSAKILQYLACGKPCISLNLRGVREVIGENHGVIYCDDIDGLSPEISHLLTDEGLRESLGKAGKEYVINNFNAPRIVGQLEDSIIKMVGHRKPLPKQDTRLEIDCRASGDDLKQ